MEPHEADIFLLGIYRCRREAPQAQTLPNNINLRAFHLYFVYIKMRTLVKHSFYGAGLDDTFMVGSPVNDDCSMPILTNWIPITGRMLPRWHIVPEFVPAMAVNWCNWWLPRGNRTAETFPIVLICVLDLIFVKSFWSQIFSVSFVRGNTVRRSNLCTYVDLGVLSEYLAVLIQRDRFIHIDICECGNINGTLLL